MKSRRFRIEHSQFVERKKEWTIYLRKRSKNTGERGHKHMNIPRSKNTKGSINETLHGDLHRHNESTVKEHINR